VAELYYQEMCKKKKFASLLVVPFKQSGRIRLNGEVIPINSPSGLLSVYRGAEIWVLIPDPSPWRRAMKLRVLFSFVVFGLSASIRYRPSSDSPTDRFHRSV